MPALARKKQSKNSPKSWAPHDYQVRAVKWLLQRSAAALFLEPGLGKTSISLMAFSLLLEANKARRALVVAPLRVARSVWPQEVLEWQEFNHLRVGVYHGAARKNFPFEKYDIVVVNPEGLDHLVRSAGRSWKKLGFDTLILDELSKFKNPQAMRFKILKRLLPTFDRRWGLTGTPVANGLLDLFGQMYILDMGEALGQYITHYRMNYFYQPNNNPWKYLPAPGSADRIYARISDIALSMTAKEFLSLPPLVDVFHDLELPDDVRKVYDKLEKDLIADIDAGAVVASNAASATTKLRQLANGGIYLTDDLGRRKVAHVHDVKMKWLKELAEELQGAPILVGYEFKHDLERLRMTFGKDLPNIGGGTTEKDAAKWERMWNANELPMLAVHPASAGHGLNMQKGSACHLALASLTWDFELYDQLVRRIWRQGTKASKLWRHHGVMKGTVDEDMCHVLRNKGRGQDALFDALLHRAK